MSNLFIDNVREFLLLNGTEKDSVGCYDSEEFIIPANDKITYPNPNAPHKPHSAKDTAGNWIPGSLILRDIPGVRGCPDDITGNIRGDFWDAKRAIQHCLGIDPNTREARGLQAQKGIGILPMPPTPEMVAQARAELNEKWRVFRVKLAEQIVKDTLEVAQARRKFGLTEGLPEREYEDALMIIEQEREERRAKLKSLGIQNPLEAEEEDDDAALLAAAQKVAAKMKAAESDIDHDKLVDMLLEDPKFVKALKVKRNVKKWPGTAPKKSDSTEVEA